MIKQYGKRKRLKRFIHACTCRRPPVCRATGGRAGRQSCCPGLRNPICPINYSRQCVFIHVHIGRSHWVSATIGLETAKTTKMFEGNNSKETTMRRDKEKQNKISRTKSLFLIDPLVLFYCTMCICDVQDRIPQSIRHICYMTVRRTG